MTASVGGVNVDGTNPSIDILLEQPGQTILIDLAALSGIQNGQLTITVPEGLILTDYEGINGSALPSAMEGFITQASEPTPTVVAGQSALFGSIVYNIAPGTGTAKFAAITVAVDKYRFYRQPAPGSASHQVPDPIEISLTGDNITTIERSIDVNASTNLAYSATGFRIYMINGTSGTVVAPLGVPVDSVGSITVSKYISGASETDIAKSAVVTLTYPAEATLNGVKISRDVTTKPNGTIPGGETAYTGTVTDGIYPVVGNTSIVHDVANHKVMFYFENQRVATGLGLNLTFNSAFTGTKYIVGSADVVHYDDTPVNYTANVASFEIASDTENRLTSLLTSDWTSATADPTVLPGLTMVQQILFKNATAAVLTNQIVRYDFPVGLNVRGFDMPVAVGGAAPTVSYMTTGGRLGTATSSAYSYYGPIWRFSPATLGLAAGETLAWAEAEVGDFPIGYLQPSSTSAGCMIFGNIAPGTGNGTAFTTTVTLTSADDTGTDLPRTSTHNTVVGDPSNSMNLDTTLTASTTSGGYSYLPGEEIEVSASFNTYSGVASGSIQRIKDPDFFIVLPKDVSLVAGSLTISQASPSSSPSIAGTETIPFADGSGRTLVRVHTNALAGWASDPALTRYENLVLRYKMVASDELQKTNLNTNALVFVASSGVAPGGTGNSVAPVTMVTADILDYNSNTDFAEKLVMQYGSGTNFTINANPVFKVYGEIGLPGGPYSADITNPVPFTAGSSAEYVLNISNNMTVDAGSFTAFVPVPKRGENYAGYGNSEASYQSANFAWNMALTGVPVITSADASEYTLSYSTDGSAYVAAGAIGDWDDVKMIKIVRTSPIEPATNDTMVFTYRIDEDVAFVNANSGATNIFNPYYYIDASSVGITGWKAGKSVAAALSTGLIEGNVWLDTSRDGLRNGTEAGMAGVEVRLHLPASGFGNDYGTQAPISGVTVVGYGSSSAYAKITTDASGNYSFPAVPSNGTNTYVVEFVNPGASTYAFTTQGVGSNVQINSNADVSTGLTAAINPTDLDNSQYVNAGFVWNEFTVTYHTGANGTGSVPSDTTKYHYNGSANVVFTPLPTRAGWSFEGWATSDGQSTAAYAVGGTVAINPITANVDLYPVWSEDTYTFTFSAGLGASFTQVTEGLKYNVNPTVVPTITSSSGADAGYDPDTAVWKANKSVTIDGTTNIAAGTALTRAQVLTVKAREDVTFTASLTATPYTITYNNVTSVGGVLGTNQPTIYTVAASAAISDPTRAGYTFDGWTVTGVSSITGDTKGVSIPLGNTGNVSLTAHWSVDTTQTGVWSVVTFDGNDNGAAVTSVANLPAPIRYNRTLSAWEDGTVFPTGTPTRDGYTFNSWNEAPDGSGASVSDLGGLLSAVAIGDTTIYAQWDFDGTQTSVWNTVTFDGNGSSAANLPADLYYNTSESAWRDGTAFPTGTPARDGYTFDSWNKKVNGSGQTVSDLAALETDVASANTTVFAQWIFDGTQTTIWNTVTFDANGGSGAPAAIYYNVTESAWRDGTVFPSAAPTRTGYTFGGWNTAANGSGQTVGTLAHLAPVSADTTIYADWTANTYKITYKLNGGTNDSSNPDDYDVTQLPVSIKNPARTGYTFDGWTATGGLTIGTETKSAKIPRDTTGNITFTAHWTIKTYTVTYIGNGHTYGAAPGTTTHNHGSNATVKTQETLARDSHSFSGWNTAADGSGSAYAAGSAISNITGNQTLYAQWTYNTPPTDPPDDPDDPDDPPRRPEDPDDDPVDPPEPPVVPPADPPAPPTTETEIRPSEDTPAPTEPVAAPATTEGFSEGDQVKLEAQSGNIFGNLANGNVPLGNFFSKGAWSLLDLILAIIAAVLSVYLIVGAVRKRRHDQGLDFSEEEIKQQGNVLKVLAIAAGVLTIVVWLILDDLSTPVTWINKWTLPVVIIFIVHIAAFFAYKIRARKIAD